MMNVLAISLVLTSLIAAAVWSPSPTHHDDHREVIVKEGHRVVVVEYDKESDGSTKLLISPHDAPPSDVDSKHTSDDNKPAETVLSGPKDLVCDAYGKCKQKIANAFGKTRDKVEEIEEHAKETVNEAIGRSKHDLSEAKDKLSDQVSDTVTRHTVGESLGKAKDGVAHGIYKAKKVAGDVVDTVKEGAVKVKNLDVVGSANTMGGDIERNVTDKVEEVAEKTVENVKKVAGEKSLGEILGKLKEVTYDIIWYFVSPDTVDAVVGLIHMLGFSTAYGMSVWVTFISSYILGRYLPRQQFGVVQSRIYPVYFKAMAYCVSAALLGHFASPNNGILNGVIRFPGLSLLSALLMVLVNMVMLEPRATKTMYEKMKIEKEEGRGVSGPARDGVADYDGATVVRPPANVAGERQDVLRLNEKLRRLNGYSSALNVLTLVALTWHMAYMGRRLHATRSEMRGDHR